MVKWPWSQPRPQLEAKAVQGYGAKESAGTSQVSPTMPFQPRLPHPANMANYIKWGNDPEASIALTVLSDIIAVDFYTEMPKDKPADHPNKKTIDDYIKRVNLVEDMQQITHTMLQKGFCPAERLPDYDIKILPPETFYIYRDKYGKVLKYTQEFFPNQVIASWEGEDMDDIILFKNEEDTSHPYGQSLLESIGPLLDIRTEMNEDIGKVLHRMGYPIPVMHTSRDKTQLDKAIEDREPDQWITLGNVNKDEFGFDIIEVASRSQPHEWIDLINLLIAEGLHAPLLLYLKNATEASATVMMESVDRLVAGRQRYLALRMEDLLFKPQISGPVPQVRWGQPKTGLEKVTLTELASVINSPALANNQKQELLKQFFPNLPEPEWDKEPQLPMQQPFTPFNKEKPQPEHLHQEITVEQLIDGINDLDSSLKLIETGFQKGQMKVTDACRHADRVITVHMKRMYGNGWEVHRDEKFQEFVQTRLMKQAGKVYTVAIKD